MKIIITRKDLGHVTYRKMAEKPAEALKELGHEVVVTDKPEEYKDFNPDFTIIPGSTVKWNQVKDLPGIKIFWNHGASWGVKAPKGENEVLKELIDNCDAVAYQSEFAKHMAQKYLESTREGPVIFNADKQDFNPSPPPVQGIVNIATTGIWREWKRLHSTEYVIDRLNKICEYRKYHLWVYGREPEKKTWGDPRYINYLGMSKDFPKYADCHFYTQLSFNDFSPATVGEAMAKGLPVICTNSGGSKDIVESSGIILDCDSFIDEPVNIYDIRSFPKIDIEEAALAFKTMADNLEMFRMKTKDQVLSKVNSTITAKDFIDLYEITIQQNG